MKKLSNKGFVLAETIVVAVFMVTIFTILYVNYFPIMGTLEKREYYDDIDSKYLAFWLKYIYEDSSYVDTCGTSATSISYFDCNKINNISKKRICMRLVKEAGLTSNPYCKTSSGSYCKDVQEFNNYQSTYAADNVSSKKIDLKYVAFITPYELTSWKNSNLSSGDFYNGASDGLIDYINLLPNYKIPENNTRNANCRLIIEIYDNKETERMPIYKYATIEVKK